MANVTHDFFMCHIGTTPDDVLVRIFDVFEIFIEGCTRKIRTFHNVTYCDECRRIFAVNIY